MKNEILVVEKIRKNLKSKFLILKNKLIRKIKIKI